MDYHSLATPVIFTLNNIPLTTSNAIADYFRKPHTKILRLITILAAHCPDNWWQQHFKIAAQVEGSPPLTVYHITRDGFAVLAASFANPKIASLKIAYLNAFSKLCNAKNCDYKPLSRQQQLHLYNSVHLLSRSSDKSIHCFIQELKLSFGINNFSEVHSDNYVAVCGFLGILPVYDAKREVEMPPRFYHYPKEAARPLVNVFSNQSWLSAAVLLHHSPQPVGQLLAELTRDGHEVEGCLLEWKATQLALARLFECVSAVGKRCQDDLNRGMQVVW